MSSKPVFGDIAGRLARVAVAVCVVGTTPVSSAWARIKEVVLHSFSGTDGRVPNGILLAPSGTLYGTASSGGTQNDGVVFALTPNGTKYDFSVLYNFCSLANCADGAAPAGQPLIEDTSGDLYGVTGGGGRAGEGTAFELVPNNGSWSLVTLYSFCSKSGCRDGAGPVAGLTYAGAQTGALYDGTSPLYGATTNGGSAFNSGVVFELTSAHGQSGRREQVIHTFCKTQFCPDGQNPSGAPILDANGRMYGNALEGGPCCSGFGGVTYRLVFDTSKNEWKYKLFYNMGSGGSSDGRNPVESLIMNSKGHLLGVTELGGTFANGTVFQIVPKGDKAQESVLYSFCTDQNVCPDGSSPEASLALDANDNIFGVTASGGLGFDRGVAFELSHGTETVLYEFCGLDNCADGQAPQGNIVRDSSGNIFGVTAAGGNAGVGVVFKISGTR